MPREINDFIYEEGVTYIGSRGGENPRPQGAVRGETLQGAAVHQVGPWCWCGADPKVGWASTRR